MKKTILFLIISIFLIQTALASCDDINMEVYAVEKNETCYTFFNVIFEDKGCEYDCFQEVSSFVVKQGNTTIKNESGIFTTYFGINFHNPECEQEDIHLIVYDNDNKVFCQKDFSLEEELVEFQALTNQNNISDEDLEIIESEKAKENDEATGSGSMGGGIPSDDEEAPISVLPKKIVRAVDDNNIEVNSAIINQIADFSAGTKTEAKTPKEKTSLSDYLIYIIPILILIVLIQIIAIKLIKKKK